MRVTAPTSALLGLASTTAAFTTCALDGGGCPPPKWEPQWGLQMSTVVQPANTSGYLDPAYGAQ